MTNRQQEYLKMIIEQYIENGEPVGSEHFINYYKLDVSSATVRHEMNVLEKEGFLEKSHVSSGRIPSTKGFDYYAKNLANRENQDLRTRLEDIFAKRRISIDFTLEEAAKAISDIIGVTLAVSSSEMEEMMKSIQLTPIDEKMATIVIVTSAGRVHSKIIDLSSAVRVEDVRVAVRLFKERLLDTKLVELPLKVEALSPILSKSIKNHEEVIRAFIGKVFDFHERITNRIYGNSNIIRAQDIDRDDIAKLIESIEKHSVWESIENKLDEDETMKIEVRPNNISLISKKINVNNQTKEIAIIGSNRMDYAEAKQAILLLDKFVKEYNK